MFDILTMDLPHDNRIEKCWVELTWGGKNGDYTAKAITYLGKEEFQYTAQGATIEVALLELAATIVVHYGLKDEYHEMSIDIPVPKLVQTEKFKKWFYDSREGGSNVQVSS
jgi:hypothetical protein